MARTRKVSWNPKEPSQVSTTSCTSCFCESTVKGIPLHLRQYLPAQQVVRWRHCKVSSQLTTPTGVLTSRPTSRDIKISGFSMSLNGVELISDCSIELTIGRRYGLLGANGCGKTNFLQCIANREVPHCLLQHLSLANTVTCRRRLA